MSEQERANQISKREWQKVTTDILFRHAVKARQDQRIREKDRVVEKGLREHQHESKQRTLSMFVHDCVPNLSPRCVRPCSNARGRCVTVAAVYDRRRIWCRDLSFDFADNSFRLRITS